jgi:glycosyltransferase involved in cell wall biosynthesis
VNPCGKLSSKLKRILWFSWKDLSHPQAGGAEALKEQIARRLARDGYEVIILTSSFPGALASEQREGYSIIRRGGRLTVYWAAYRYYKKHLQGWADLVIDEVNTIPFFTKYYVQEKNILMVPQLARQIWFYQLFFPASLIGYFLEPVFLWFLNDRQVITISDSTRNNLGHYGFRSDRISIIRMGTDIKPIPDLSKGKKFQRPTMIAFGNIRPMKRTAHILQAFELTKKEIEDLQLVLAGNAKGKYGQQVLSSVDRSPYRDSIQFLGSIDHSQKEELLQQCHIIVVTSVKEGWGLVVTEANSQGTPAVVYNVDGLRDSTRDGETGVVTKTNTPEALARAIKNLIQDRDGYQEMRQNAWRWSKEITFDNGYCDFLKAVEGL